MLDQDELLQSSNSGSFYDEQWSDAQDTLVTDSKSESEGVDPAEDQISSSMITAWCRNEDQGELGKLDL